jgi:hypothetical protein
MVRSRITLSAISGSVQRLASSDFAFSSARRWDAASTSKMPPQQSDRLLDRFDQLFSFSTHHPTKEFKSAMSSGKTPFCGATPPKPV